MKYFYRAAGGQRVGPYTAAELRQLHLSGVVKAETEIFSGDSTTGVPLRESWARISDEASAAAASPGTRARSTIEDITSRTTEDIRALIPHLLVPLRELRTLKWIEDKRLLTIAVIGLLPLFLLVIFAERGEVRSAYWGLALYSSVLWAVFFYYVFPAPRITWRLSAICFFTTGVVSIAVLLMAYGVPPLSWFYGWTRSSSLLVRIFGVGLPE
jgi:hypothetical protein